MKSMINSRILEFQSILKYSKLVSTWSLSRLPLPKYVASFLYISVLDILIIHNYNSKNAIFTKVTLKDSHIHLLSIYLLHMSLYWNVREIKFNFK